jgi:L-fuconolactonase
MGILPMLAASGLAGAWQLIVKRNQHGQDAHVTIMVIDSHHHFWRYTPQEFGWIDEDHAVICRDFLPEDLQREMAGVVDGVISIEARQTEDETRFLLGLADRHTFILGVVGWVDLRAPGVREALERFNHPKLVGVRHVVQAEPDGFLLGDEFNRGIDALRKFDLRYGILILEHQLPETIAFVDRHPNQVFIVDHLAKPNVKGRQLEPWRTNLCKLAKRPNVYCKIAGGIFEADPKHWTATDLRPYFGVALEAFGPSRLMFGSNWPLTAPAGGYRHWLNVVRDWAAAWLSPAERDRLFSGTAIEAYKLGVTST